VRMLTTDGPTCSTKSVKSGSVRFCAKAGDMGNKAATHKDMATAQVRSDFFRVTSIVNLVFK
jgi:hypothetical protein